MNKLDELQELIKTKLPPEKRTKVFGEIAGSVICILAKRLIKSSGYSVTSTVLSRDLKELGRKNAIKIMKDFGIEKGNPESASKALRIAATLLGLKFEIEGKHAIIKECPYGTCVLEYREPFICNVCQEFCKGIVEEVTEGSCILVQVKDFKSDGYCLFEVRKKL